MSNMVIQTNVLALNAHRNMKGVGDVQAKASAKLSSGYKINSAADDAAGLAISEKMRAQIRGLDMASKNGQDGISLIQTAEGGMQEIDNMLQRIRELTVQSANDTNEHNKVGTGDRQKMQDEVDQLASEIDSMAGRVEFNKKKVIDGSYSDPRELLASASAKYTTVSGQLATATAASTAAMTSKTSANNDFGVVNDIRVRFEAAMATSDARLTAASTALANVTLVPAAGAGIDTAAIDATLQKFKDDLIAVPITEMNDVKFKALYEKHFKTETSGANIGKNAAGVQLVLAATAASGGSITGAFTATNAIGTGVTAAATVAAAGIGTTVGVPAIAAGAGLAVQVSALYTAAGTIFGEVELRKSVDSAANAAAAINGVTVATSGTAFFAIAGNNTYTATNTGNTSLTAGTVTKSVDLYKFVNQYTKTKVDADLDYGVKSKNTEFLTAQRSKYNVQLKAASNRASELGTDAPGLYFQVGANSNQSLQLTIGSVKTDILGIGDGKGNTNINLLKNSGSDITKTLDNLDEALSYVTTERSKLGAAQNRLEYTIKSLDISSENLSASESRIRDTDMAKEMSKMTKANVLQQATISMLSQANQGPQSLLALLR